MNKSIAIIRPFAGENRETFCRRALHIAEEITATCSPAGLKLTRTVEPPPRFSVIPFRSDPVAVISAVGAPDDSMNAVAGCNGVSAFFAVSEAMPVNGEPLWALNEPAPGAGLLTLFRARKDISRAVFLDRWFNGHTPLTLQLHPLTNYNRNEVLSTIGPGARHYDGIVEERTACRADLLNPFRFFGKPPFTLWHMLSVFRDIRGFIDTASIETYFVEERLICRP